MSGGSALMLLRDQLTDHFKLSEFSCKGAMIITPEFITFSRVLEKFRVWYNRPIVINSGFRTPAHNKEVGGVLTSLHLQALAVDFFYPAEFAGFNLGRRDSFVSNVVSKWFELCRSEGKYGEVCRYNWGLHLGMRSDKARFVDKRG